MPVPCSEKARKARRRSRPVAAPKLENLANAFRLDRSAIRIVDVDGKPVDVRYWRTQPIRERLRAIEFLRQAYYGYDACAAPLSRVLEVVDMDGRPLKPGKRLRSRGKSKPPKK